MPHTRFLRSIGVAAAAALLLAGTQPPAQAEPEPSPSDWTLTQGTTDDLRKALITGQTTCEEVVRGYLARIEAYDDELNSMITVSETAIAEARELDREQATKGQGTDTLHCVPLVLKDNIDAAGLPTTAGSRVLEGMLPPDDAFITKELEEAGAVILGKANLDEFAFGFGGSSALGGQVANPYDLSRGPGGSSSGTGAAVAAGLALAGLGTDTGGSIRIPSSAQGLVGIRPSMRLVSQDGVIPLSAFQDTAGPMCRAVEDCAVLLGVLSEFDRSSFSGQYSLPQQRDDRGVLLTSESSYDEMVGTDHDGYTDHLKRNGLRNARIGVVRDLFGDDPEVLAVLDKAMAAMVEAGAVVEDVEIPDLDAILDFTSTSRYEFRDHLTNYLQDRPVDGYARTFEEVAAQTESRQSTFDFYAAMGADRYENPDYNLNTLQRPGYVRPRLDAALDNRTLQGETLGEPYDALLYPTVLSLPRVGRAPVAGNNNRLSPFSGFPALTMPAGFTPVTAEHPRLPVGMELLGREFDEGTLIRLAYGYQESVEGTELARISPPMPEQGAEPVRVRSHAARN